MHLKSLVTEFANFKLPNVDFWDIRVEDNFETNIQLVDGDVVACTASPSLGAFVRVRKGGFWFYEATTDLKNLSQILTKLASQTPLEVAKKIPFTPAKQPEFIAINSASKKFSAVSMDEKLKLIQGYESVFRGQGKVISTRARYKDSYKVKSYINSVGTRFEFDFNQAGIIVVYTMKDGDKLFQDVVRGYGASFDELKGHDNDFREYMKESEQFISAPAVTPGKYKVLLDPKVAGIFTHESFGHKSEADFALGNEQALADWSIGKKVGADCLTIVDYGGHAGTSGYCPIDDDGNLANKNYLIKNGILSSRLHSQETAQALNEMPTGNSRAMNFEFEPMVRMTSTYIEPGNESLESIMKRSEGAILLEGANHGTGLSTFTIAPTRAYQIGKGGKREPVRVTVISGTVFETLMNIEAVSKDFELVSSAIGGCGKNDQWPLPVADGGPYVLIKEMQVS